MNRLLASELYARSQGEICQGNQPCHWCGAPCERLWTHDDPPPIIGVKSTIHARHPSSPYICRGCFLFKRPRLTVWFLGGGFKDGKCPRHFGWLITPKGSWAIDSENPSPVYEFLLKPEPVFSLSFLSEPGITNRLQLTRVNELGEIKADTTIHYTINNIPHHYTIYELESAIRQGAEGREPGVQALLRLLGDYSLPEASKEPRGKGRPSREEKEAHSLRRTISRSG